MPWPQSQDYNEAIQNPASSFADAELRGGQAVTNALGVPLPRSGNFADVYEFEGAGGARWAVKCFTREVLGLQERYEEISRFLSRARLPFTVDFHYLDQGIRIRGQWYPVLKMQWVSGFLLNEFVRNNLDKPHLLDKLVHIWLRMGRRLHDAGMAHADLQHGNVILVPASRASALAVKLIDYDGMFVPALASRKSGEVGHPSYQHPERLQQGTYTADVDRLPLLAIACGLRSLTVAGKPLWERHDNSDNLLFREADLRQPAASALFRELWNIPDDAAHDLVGHLTIGLAGPLGQVPLLHELANDEGAVRPLSPAQEDYVTAVLGPGARVRRALPAAVPGPAARMGISVAEPNPWETLADNAPAARKRKSGRSLMPWALAAAIVLGAAGGGFLLLSQKNQEPEKPNHPISQAEHDKHGRATSLKPAVTGQGPDEEKKTSQRPPLKELPNQTKQPPPEKIARVSSSLPLDDLDPENIAADDRHKDLPELVGVLKGYPGEIWSLALAADDRFAAVTGSDRQTICLWEFRNPAKAIKTIGSATGGVAFSPDGKKLAVVTGNRVQFWNVPFEKTLFAVPAGKTTALAYAPDGKTLALANEFGIKLIDLTPVKPRERRILPAPGDIRALAFSKGGEILACGSGGGTIQIWNLKEDPPRTEAVQAEAGCSSLTVAPDGKSLAAGGADGMLQVWDLDDEMAPKSRWTRQAHTHTVSSVSFAPDGKTLVSAGGGKLATGPFQAIWWKSTGAKIKAWPLPARCGSCTFSSSGRYLALGCYDRRVYILRLPNEKTLVAAGKEKETKTREKTAEKLAPEAVKEITIVLNRPQTRRTNLLKLIDADNLPGKWRFDGETLVSDGRRMAPPLEIPLSPFPDEYEIRATVEREQGKNALSLVLLLGRGQFALVLDDNGDTGIDLWLDRNKTWLNSAVNPSLRPRRLFKPSEPSEIACAVHKKGVQLQVDGNTIFTTPWMPAKRFVPQVPAVKEALGIHTAKTTYRITKLDILPLGKRPEEVAVKLPLGPTLPPSTAKWPRPKDDDLAKMELALRKMFEKEFEGRGADDKLALAQLMFREGLAAQTAVRCYACLHQAASAAAEIAAMPIVMQVAAALNARFDIDRDLLLVEAVEQAAKSADRVPAVVAVMQTLDALKEADDFKHGTRLKAVKLAATSLPLDAALKDRFALFELCHKEHERVKDDLARLNGNPEDKAANLAAGKYLCFFKEDWGKGLKALRQGDDEALAELAFKELAGPKEARDQLEIGDLWSRYAAAEKLPERVKENIKRHARRWFGTALANLPLEGQKDAALRLHVPWGVRSLKSGLEASYALKDSRGQTKSTLARLDHQLNFKKGFDFGEDGFVPERFLAAWQGYLLAPRPGYYRLTTTADGGCKVVIDGSQVLDACDAGGRHSTVVLLTGKPQKLRIDYRSKGRNDSLILSWALIGGFPEQPVPPEALYH